MHLVRRTFYWLVSQMVRAGFIDEQRGRRTVDLAWPRIVTGFARMSQQAADLAMVGIVLGPPALAGMAFAFAYWRIGNQLSIGLSGGTISQVSQRFGNDDSKGIDLATKQSVVVAVLLMVPIAIVFWQVPTFFIRLLGAGPVATEYGAVYLSVVSVALVFEAQNKIASRVLVGVNDAVTPMYVRAGGAFANIVLNAIFIFGMGLGVYGAALGSVISTVLTTGLFFAGFLGLRFPVIGRFPVRLTLTPPYVDVALTRQLITISSPLMARWVVNSLVIFPFLAIVSVFGTGAVAAFEVARRIRDLSNAPGWGFGLASSSLVGQQLGAGEEDEAKAYGWDILRFATVVYLGVAFVVFVLARPIALVFVSEPDVLRQAVLFVRVGAFAVIWLGLDMTVTGSLRGAGDTRWPFYGKLAGLYLFAIPIAYLGVITPVGITAVYVAFIAETFVPAVVSYLRFWSEGWIAVSRTYRPSPAD